MRLTIKQTETCEGYLLALCDENSVPLPGQLSVSIHSAPNELVTATVVFLIGQDVEICEGDRCPD